MSIEIKDGLVTFLVNGLVVEIEEIRQVYFGLLALPSSIAIAPGGAMVMNNLKGTHPVGLSKDEVTELEGRRDNSVEPLLKKSAAQMPHGWAVRLDGVAVRYYQGNFEVYTSKGWAPLE